MTTRLLAITGSHRQNGNSYSLVRSVLDSMDADYDIIQLADREIEFCTLCGECIDRECALKDDLDEILAEMKRADGIVFAVPKYLVAPSKFLTFLERLNTIVHMRRFRGYSGPPKNPDYRLISGGKPFCFFALSGTGNIDGESLSTVVEYIESIGLVLVKHDRAPFIAVNVKAGDDRGDVLSNKVAIGECKDLVQRVIAATKRR